LKIDATEPPAVTAALAAHVEVENGGFFTAPTGRLDAFQFVRIVRAREFLAKVNLLLEVAAQKVVGGGLDGVEFSADTRELLTEFLRSGEKMLTLEAGRIEFRLPCTKGDLQKLLLRFEELVLRDDAREMLRRLVVAQRRRDNGAITSTEIETDALQATLKVEELRSALRTATRSRFLWDNEFTLERGQEQQRIGLGVQGNGELGLVKASDGLYSDNFLKVLRERRHPIEEGVPDQEIRRRFADFLTRQAALPAGLQAARTK
jgi:hypothetical protein